MTQFSHSPHFVVVVAAILRACDTYEITKNSLTFDGEVLSFHSLSHSFTIPYTKDQNIHILGAGKASAAMASAVEEIFGDKLSGGIVAVKRHHGQVLTKTQCIEAGHPIPDEASERAGRLLYEYAKKCNENDIVLCLFSGGASACCVYPFCDDDNEVHFSLADKIRISELLLASGACIDEINAVRKHFSRIKGGRLAEALYPARIINCIISDVIGDRLDTIASGMTVPDVSTFSDVESVFQKYDLWVKIPDSIASFVRKSEQCYETPKPDNPIFNTISTLLLASNRHALDAAAKAAESIGFRVVVADTPLSGEATEAALSVYTTLKTYRTTSVPLCFIWGGETTVTLKGKGKGGRNQEAALAFICQAIAHNDPLSGVHALFLATDGTDGPTDAAGALVNAHVMKRIRSASLDPLFYLHNNNSYPFLDSCGALLRTGPTKTNVCDVWIVLMCPSEY